MPKKFYLVAASLLLSLPLSAQTLPSAEGPHFTVWVGASFSTFNPDYGCSNNSPFSCWSHQITGIGPHMDTSSFLFGRIGAEGEAHFLRWHGPTGMTQDSYLGGPRLRLARYHSLNFSGKVLLGVGRIQLAPGQVGSGTYLAYAPGGTMDYHVARRVSACVDYEYQIWPAFKGLNAGHSGLTPNGLSLGVSYALTSRIPTN